MILSSGCTAIEFTKRLIIGSYARSGVPTLSSARVGRTPPVKVPRPSIVRRSLESLGTRKVVVQVQPSGAGAVVYGLTVRSLVHRSSIVPRSRRVVKSVSGVPLV